MFLRVQNTCMDGQRTRPSRVPTKRCSNAEPSSYGSWVVGTRVGPMTGR